MKNVIIYCRVSSDEQAENTSLDYQERVIRAYCNNHRYNVITCHREDFSAKHYDMKRPEMKKIYTYCKKHRKAVDAIYFLRWDRFTRSAEFAFKYIREFREMGIEVNSVENPIDFNSADWATLIGVYCGNAQSENTKISRRTKAGMQEHLEKGEWTHKAPYGYINVRTSKTSTHIEINPQTALWVKLVFEEVARGVETATSIWAKYHKQGMSIQQSAYLAMLRNRFYIGEIWVPEYDDKPAHYVKAVHEPLISVDIFNKVQDNLDGKRKGTPKVDKTVNPDFFLRKFLVCPVCGHALTASNSRGNGGVYGYYHCCKDGKHLRVKSDKANRTFLDYMHNLKPHNAIIQLYNAFLMDALEEQNRCSKDEISKLQIELNKIKTRKTTAEDKYLDGELSSESYASICNRFENEIKKIENEIEMLQTIKNKDIAKKMEYGVNLLSNMDIFLGEAPVEMRIKLLGSIFSEKIEFDGINYRTNNYNKVLDYIYLQNSELQGLKEKDGENFSTLSVLVPETGVEPVRTFRSTGF